MSQKLSRRDQLKLIAAATGATIISSVPNKWVTPIVEFGALRAHAQASARGSANIHITVGSPDRPTKTGKPNSLPFYIFYLRIKNSTYDSGQISVLYLDDLSFYTSCSSQGYLKKVSNIPYGTYTVYLDKAYDYGNCSFTTLTQPLTVNVPGPIDVFFNNMPGCCG